MSVLSGVRVAAQAISRTRYLWSRNHRAFGSAALDYCYDDYEEEEYSTNLNRPLEDSEGSVSGRGIQWVVIGDPTVVNRHVYAERLSNLLRVPHISMATLLRQDLHPRSSLYKQIASALNQGKLVSEEVIFGLLSKKLEEGYSRGETGFILDGIPRTRIQAEILEQIVDIDLVLNLKCPECLLKKHLGNQNCSSCQDLLNMGTSNLGHNPHSKDNQMEFSASATNAKHSFVEQRKYVEEYYRKQKKLLDFQVAAGPGETWQGLLAALHLQHISSAVTSSHKLSA